MACDFRSRKSFIIRLNLLLIEIKFELLRNTRWLRALLRDFLLSILFLYLELYEIRHENNAKKSDHYFEVIDERGSASGTLIMKAVTNGFWAKPQPPYDMPCLPLNSELSHSS